MATNLALDPALLDRVVAVSGEPTKKAAVTLALKEFIDDAEAAGFEVSVRDIPDHARGTLERSWGDELTHLRWEN